MPDETPSTEPKTQEQINDSHLAMLKSELRDFIRDARAENTEGKLRSRPLSEAITCAETAYLWLCQVLGDDGLLNF